MNNIKNIKTTFLIILIVGGFFVCFAGILKLIVGDVPVTDHVNPNIWESFKMKLGI